MAATYSTRLLCVSLALALGCAIPAHADSQDPESLFVAGQFARADSGFAVRLAKAPKDTLALLRRGTIALFHNRTGEARRSLDRALRAGATPRRTESLIAESFYRENAFDSAAVHLRRAGQEARAKQLESFHGRQPYAIEGPDAARIPFVQTDLLPVVELSVNGRGPFFFIIDTGGSELVLDPGIADSVHASRFGSVQGTFAGGTKADVEQGAVDSVRLGSLLVRNVPVKMLDTQRFAMVAGGRQVAGILGTSLLARFRSTLDYPGGALLLARRNSPSVASSDSATVIPFWMAGDHYMLARGTLGSSGPLLFFIDTGLAGAAFTGPPSVLADAGIALHDTTSFTGHGAGGAVRATPFPLPRVALGPVEVRNLMGMLGPFPPTLERSLGPRVAGIVSHAFFRSMRVTFDFDRMEITLARPRG